MTPNEIEEQVKAYELKRAEYRAFTHALESLLKQLLIAKGIGVVTIEARAKTIESFCGKIEREDKDYSDPINQITDLAGIRIITYQISDIESVSEIIENNLKVDPANSIDKGQSLEADRFGYASVHYVVSLEDTRAGLPEYAAFAGLRGEIQVRTVLQHAWAAIDHKLRYKSKEEIPAKLRRQLYRISALLETADEQFESLTARITEVRAGYSEAVSKGSLDIPLDVDSLSAYAECNEHAIELFNEAETLGIVIAPNNPNTKLPEYSHLLTFLDLAGTPTLQEFDVGIEKTSAKATDILSQIISHWSDSVSSPGLRLVVTKDSLLRMAYLLALPQDLAGDVRTWLGFGSTLRDALGKVYIEINNASNFSIPNAQQTHSH